MLENKEELKSKILYRASYRGSKEMDILMTNFVKSLINNLNLEELKELNYLVIQRCHKIKKILKIKLFIEHLTEVQKKWIF